MSAIFAIVGVPVRCGLAFFVSAEGHFLTCAHMFEPEPDGRYVAILDANQPAQTTEISLLRISLLQDLVLGKIDVDNVEYLRLAADLPNPGARVTAFGYGGVVDAAMRIVTTTCTYLGHAANFAVPAMPPYAAKAYHAVITADHLPQGYSGGPVINEAGHVIGLHSANDTDTDFGDVSVSVALTILRGAVDSIAQ